MTHVLYSQFYSMVFRAIYVSVAIQYASASADAKPNTRDLELHFLPNKGAPASSHSPHHRHAHSSEHGNDGNGAVVPFSEFSQMFPFDLPPGAHVRVIHLNPLGAGGGGPAGDSIIESILSELSKSFHDDMKPLLTNSQADGRGAEHPCAKDVEKYCGQNHGHNHEHLSNLHCLGLHSVDVSEQCAKDIQNSLPFVCSLAISEFCSIQDTLDRSILDCLEQAQSGKDSRPLFTRACSDSMVATRSIISRMKHQDMALVDRRTGRILKSTAVIVSRTVYIVLIISVLLIVGMLLYGIWSRDDETSVLKSIQYTARNMVGWAKTGSVPADPRAVEMRFNKKEQQSDRAL